MALISHTELPALDDLRDEGLEVATVEHLAESALPKLSIGLLNLMPDAALAATDRQFLRLVGAFSDRADILVSPFTLAAESRGERARRHIAAHYLDFEEVRESGLDALIITGANPAQHHLSREGFWDGLVDVVTWARDNCRSVLCSCLASHAVLEIEQGVRRAKLPDKRWGVFDHRVLHRHWLVEGIAGRVAAPHSHWYDMTSAMFESAGARPIIEGDEAGVHLAVSDDDFYVLFQGHPEYEHVSLFKEYAREIDRYFSGERGDYPPYPSHYLDDGARSTLDEYRTLVDAARAAGNVRPPIPRVADWSGSPPWSHPGSVIYRNWLTRVLSGVSA